MSVLPKDALLTEYLIHHDQQTVAWLNSDDLQQTFGLTYQITCQSHRNWLNQHENYHIWAIEEDNQHLGNAILNVMPRHNKATLEIYIGHAAGRGKGVGKRALYELLEKGFNGLNLNRISLVTRCDNVAAENLYKGCGFTEEGVERQSIKTQHGYVDQRLWALLKHDWVTQHEL